MKIIVIAAMACATAITCTLLLRIDKAPAHRRYQLYSIEETSSANGKNVRSIYRLDTVSGKTWRISSNPVPTAAKDSQNNPMVIWAAGWEELPDSPEAAVAKAQRAISHQ